jgi:hypothetical protein
LIKKSPSPAKGSDDKIHQVLIADPESHPDCRKLPVLGRKLPVKIGKWRAVDRTPFAHPISQNPLPGGKILAVEQFPLPNQ